MRPVIGLVQRLCSAVGGFVRDRSGLAPDPGADRLVGQALLLAVLGVVAWPPLGGLAGGGWWLVHRWRRSRRCRSKTTAAVEVMPDVIDLLALAIRGGATVTVGLEVLARRGPHEVRAPVTTILERVSRGDRLVGALDVLDEQLGDAARPLVAALRAAEVHGAPLVASLAVLGSDARAARHRLAELSARRAPVLLLFPLVLCVLPALGLLTVVPVVVSGIASIAA